MQAPSLIGQLCGNCKKVILTEENLSVATDRIGICSTCVPKGEASIPPGMLEK